MDTGKGIGGRYMQIYNLPEIISFLNSLEEEEKITHIQSILSTILVNTIKNKSKVQQILNDMEMELMLTEKTYLAQIWKDKKRELIKIENMLSRLRNENRNP